MDVLTIGHTNHSSETFVALLRGAGVTAVADVRSAPFSRFTAQFNQPELKITLRSAGIAYSFLGAELGARPQDRSCYRGTVAAYDLIARTPLFQAGLDRVIEGASQFVVALMCMEKDPLDCHRCILVGRHLVARGIRMRHILANGRIEEGSETDHRLIRLTGQDIDDLFAPRGGDPLERAYDLRGAQIAFNETSDDGHRTADEHLGRALP